MFNSLLLRGGHEDDLLLGGGARRAHAPADLLAAAVLRRARQHDVAQGDGGQVDTKNIQSNLASLELHVITR